MRILEEICIEILNQEAIEVLRKHGAKVDGPKVFLDREFVMEKLALVPSEFTLTPRNLDKKITIGG